MMHHEEKFIGNNLRLYVVLWAPGREWAGTIISIPKEAEERGRVAGLYRITRTAGCVPGDVAYYGREEPPFIRTAERVGGMLVVSGAHYDGAPLGPEWRDHDVKTDDSGRFRDVVPEEYAAIRAAYEARHRPRPR